ncbi:hypothetical protein FRX31_017086 [Thalictrum thalictroides]|uniref:Uncharacterized protein n=1 Tax=Thalictrum thalictroides TaxID=46969 RepID=A0A7J6W8S3_THATH|nr:hypothetical protein FRX31_017086 [Thalictrum thalictroides]
MGEVNQKMEALMKACDDITFNPTKYATAEIMNVEPMEHQNQKEMHEAKEDVLNIFLNFKATMEAKIAEMETTSFNQRRQIEELEVRLQKTEYVANDFRSELTEMKEELKKMKNSRAHPLDKPNVKGSAGFNEAAQQENQIISAGSFQVDPWDSGPALLSPSNRKDARLPTAIGHCSSVPGNVSIPTAHQGNLAEENNAGNRDQLSNLRRSKKPQLNRSDCTKKGRACGKTRPTGKLSLPVHADNQSSGKKSKTRKVGPVKKNPTQLQELLQEGNSRDQGQDFTLSGVPSKKRGTAPRKLRSTLSTYQINELPVRSSLNRQIFENADIVFPKGSGKKASIEIEATSPNSSVSPLAPVPSFNTTNTDAKLGSAVDVQTDAKGIKAKGFENAASGAHMLIDEVNLTTQNTQDASILGIPDLSLNLRKVEMQSRNSDTKTDENSYGMATSADDKPLKYTFQRKRKRPSLNSPDRSTNLADSTSRKKQSETQSNGPEPQKSSLMLESPPADLQVVRVACQVRNFSSLPCLNVIGTRMSFSESEICVGHILAQVNSP